MRLLLSISIRLLNHPFRPRRAQVLRFHRGSVNHPRCTTRILSATVVVFLPNTNRATGLTSTRRESFKLARCEHVTPPFSWSPLAHRAVLSVLVMGKIGLANGTGGAPKLAGSLRYGIAVAVLFVKPLLPSIDWLKETVPIGDERRAVLDSRLCLSAVVEVASGG